MRRGWWWTVAAVWAALWAGAVWPGAWATTSTRTVCPPEIDGASPGCRTVRVQTNLLTGEVRTLGR